jgi:glutamyl-tRNA synthetase
MSTTEATTTNNNNNSATETQQQQQQVVGEQGVGGDDELNKLFPNKGKSILDLPPRMRFAPSPTGSLHVGGARTALYNWLVAKKGQLDFEGSGGDGGFVLRVEDTDLARSTKESENSVLADLSWLGLIWDEGPDMPLAKYGPYRQSERSDLYTKIAKSLIEQGKAYPCFCTPEELDEMKAKMEAEGIPPRYDGTWRDADPDVVAAKIAAGDPYTVRFKVPPGARVVIEDAVRGTVSWDAEATVGDFILLRSSGVPVYNFCVAVDDASMGITTVIRAEEHLTNTLRQGLILDALGAPRPRYAHCSLILGEDKQKLSKRHGATSCNQFRLDGFLPDAMINYLALLGWNDGTDNEIFTRDELIEAFDIDRIVKSPSVFDMDKLKWVNSQHLKRMEVEEILHLVEEQLGYMDMMKEGADDAKRRDFVFASTALAKQMMETLQDAATNAKTVLGYNLPATFADLEDGSEAKEMVKQGNFYGIAMKIIEMYESGSFPMPDSGNLLAAFMDGSNKAIVEDNQVGGDENSYPQAYKTTMKALAKEMSVKGKNLFHPVRLALTGEMSGQDVTKQMSLLAMAEEDGTVVNAEAAGVVPIEARMEKLKSFCDSIPEEFRASKQGANDDKAKQSKESKKDGKAAASDEVAAATAAAPAVADPLDGYEGPPITALDIRVGRINKVWTHPEADKLFCEEIDVGEDEPRQIASGLRPYMNEEDLEGRMVLVLCNLKERKLAGFPSHGMVLCASNEDHSVVKLVSVPVEAKIGERVTVPGFNFEGEDAEPYAENKVGKKKVFEKIAPLLQTNEYGVPTFGGRPLLTSAGVCTSPINKGSVS